MKLPALLEIMTDRPTQTDQPSDGRTDRRTLPLIGQDEVGLRQKKPTLLFLLYGSDYKQ